METEGYTQETEQLDLAEVKRKKGNAFGKGGWGHFWEDPAGLSLKSLVSGMTVSTTVSLDLSAVCGAVVRSPLPSLCSPPSASTGSFTF